jgi:hypothetical protein
MHSEVRLTLVLVAAAAMLVSGWFAYAAVSANVATLGHWRRLEGTVVGIGSPDYIEVELGRDPDTRRVRAAGEHTLGLGFLRRVTVYEDPADPGRHRAGGVLQLWLWPATLAALAAVFCLATFAAFSTGRGPARGGWNLSPPPAFAPSRIVIARPASETRAPLFWSLLGVVAFGCGILASGMSPFSRLWALLAGGLFMLGTWTLALHNRTYRVSADSAGLRAASVLAWREVRWEPVKSVECREVYPTNYRFSGKTMPFPGRTTKSIVFAGANGRSLLRMSTRMQPRDDVRRLFELCAERTGLTEQFRRIEVPDF